MSKYNKNPKQKEFARLMLTGKYTQREAAKMLDLQTSTACRWAQKIPALQYSIIRNRLISQVKPLSLQYGENSELVNKLIKDIEKVESLIKKS